MKKWKIELKKTKSSTYLLPIFDRQINFKFLHQLHGSYLYNNHKDLEFCVLYKFLGKERFLAFEKEMMANPLFIGHEDYDDYVLYKFKPSENIQKEIDKFIAGKYSEFTEVNKNAIHAFLVKRGVPKAAGRIRQILNKDKARRLELEKTLGETIDPNAELSSPPDLSLEVFSNYVSEIKYNRGDYGDS